MGSARQENTMTNKRWSVIAAVGLSLVAACEESGTTPGGGILGGGQPAAAAPATAAAAPATPATAPGTPTTAAATPATPGTPATAVGTPAIAGATLTPGADAGAADRGAVTADEDVDPETAAEGEGNGDYAEPGGQFTVAFPSPPKVTERTTKSSIGSIRLQAFTAAKGDTRMVVNMGTIIPRAGRRLSVGQIATQVRDENLAGLKIARKDEHAFETSGLPGLAVSYLGASGKIEVRGVMHIIVRREPLTVYVAHAMAPPAADEASLRLFVESFEPAATVSAMDAVLARATEEPDAAAARAAARAAAAELADVERRAAEKRAAAKRSSLEGGTANYRWSGVRTSGPDACVFFAGPVSRASRRSYTGGSGTWIIRGRRAQFELGSSVDFSGTYRNGRVNVRNVERASLTGNPYTFTETITGTLDEDGYFRGTYRYSDCRNDGSERCPGPCTIRATLTGTP
jgi:hypothetical protein